MQVVILAGGFGSRLAEETALKPKPMVEIGGRPIIVHIMNLYSQAGFSDFIVACGYKADCIKLFFNNFFVTSSDFTISLRDGMRSTLHDSSVDWTVSVIDTGLHTMTGGRLLRLRRWLGGGTFMVTYGDGVADVDLQALLRFHRSHGRLATVTAVAPPARFGNLELDGDRVSEFTEKVQKHETWINGGFFVFEPGALNYVGGDGVPLEREPLTELARDGQLMAFRHYGFWHPMDTVRDRNYLEELWGSGKAPWARPA